MSVILKININYWIQLLGFVLAFQLSEKDSIFSQDFLFLSNVFISSTIFFSLAVLINSEIVLVSLSDFFLTKCPYQFSCYCFIFIFFIVGSCFVIFLISSFFDRYHLGFLAIFSYFISITLIFISSCVLISWLKHRLVLSFLTSFRYLYVPVIFGFLLLFSHLVSILNKYS